MSLVSARTFNQSPSKVKAMADEGPVFVTDRGRPTVVILSMNDYEQVAGRGSVRDSLRMDVAFPGDVDVEFELVVTRELGRVAEL